ELPADSIATIAGRYYAMDRDGRWERTDLALEAMLNGTSETADDPVEAIGRSYEAGITDEFVVPITLEGRPRVDLERDALDFFNGGREEPWPGEERILVPSPRDVPSYDLKPEMSADEVAERFAGEIGNGYGFGVVNFANPDMVGHTGSIPAVVRAVETTDRCLGEVVDAVERAGGVSLVTADHGNAEQMLEPDGVSPHTAHTTNLVPLVVTAPGLRISDG